MARKEKPQPLGNTEVRRVMLQYFYDRNANSTSVRGKKGSAVMVSVLRAELKAAHELSAQQVMSNLTYLLSQRWVATDEVAKSFSTGTGTVIPSVTTYYVITAAGIDKIEGPGEFTRDPFHGIKIEATGHNVITVGDGNQVNVAFKDAGEALSALSDAVRSATQLDESQKLGYVADIQSIQAQLAKPEPSKVVLQSVWTGMKALATVNGVTALYARVAGFLAPLIAGTP